MLEKVRRLLKANKAQYILKLHEINLEICALKQKIDYQEKREQFQSRHVANLEAKLERFTSFISFEDDFDSTGLLETSVVGSSQGESQETSVAGSSQGESQEI